MFWPNKMTELVDYATMAHTHMWYIHASVPVSTLQKIISLLILTVVLVVLRSRVRKFTPNWNHQLLIILVISSYSSRCISPSDPLGAADTNGHGEPRRGRGSRAATGTGGPLWLVGGHEELGGVHHLLVAVHFHRPGFLAVNRFKWIGGDKYWW